jgi:hypothetical protein
MGSGDKFDTATALERMHNRTQEARDHEAGEMFAAGKFDAAMSAAATRGQSSVIIQPSSPMDVSDTDTAKAFFKMLKEAGFIVEWKIRQHGEEEPSTYLRIGWGPGSGKK